MTKRIKNVNDYILPVDPYFLVEVVKGVSVDTVETDGLAEVPVDNKYVGQHMDIVRILKCYNSKDPVFSKGDTVLVWSTAVQPFDIKGIGTIYLVKRADIFSMIDYDNYTHENKSRYCIEYNESSDDTISSGLS